ncbi:MAG: CBS domain-containing protein [Mariprofundaceae bacterium]
MHADLIMTKDLVTCGPDQTISEVIDLLHDKSVRMVPVVDDNNHILGAINTLTFLSSLVPEYIVQGYLKSIPYAPDMGVLRKHYREILNHKVSDVMDRDPTIVMESESLLSVTAALITYDRFEYALVVDKQQKLLGIVASSDILRCLNKFSPEELFDA